mmetsp:Transcript_54656/g.127824  ORF Transcript_54656/g.127824 Transcript_54656/m.127824 type:complete len:1057 (-) Transcript_54656:87-3257(-)
MLRGNRSVAILRESRSKWERRAPLSPSHVARLVKDGLRVLVQPSSRRIFADAEYVQAGGEIVEDVSPASLILGVKEVPIENLIPERTYAFFSHTIKAQPYNMPLLDAMLEKRVRLVDYECIREGGKRPGDRLVAFGPWAGTAGMINLQRGLGERLLAMGYNTPFLGVASSFMYPDLRAAVRAVRECGDRIAAYGTPPELGPLTFAFLGDGKVSKGAQAIFRELPHEMVAPEDLPELVTGGQADLKKVYGCVCETQHFVQPKAGGKMVPELKEDYYANPQNYTPIFHEVVAPYCSVLVNCVFWTEMYPRILTTAQAEALHRDGRSRMLAIADITCDLHGSIEFLNRFTTSEVPFYLYDVEMGGTHNDLDSPGILMLSHDTLPSELPRDSTEAFGDALVPFIRPLAESDGTLPFESQQDIPVEVLGAVICDKGKLTPPWAHIASIRADSERIASMAAGTGAMKLGDPGFGHKRVLLKGHLFDNGVINKVLDLVERHSGCAVRIADWSLGASMSEETTVLLDIEGSAKPLSSTMRGIEKLVAALSELSPIVMRTLPPLEQVREQARESSVLAAEAPAREGPPGTYGQVSMPQSQVLLLGSGLVCGPVLDYLHQQQELRIVLASNDLSQAEALAADRERIHPMQLNVVDEVERLSSLIKESDLVISLLPATMHLTAANSCIAYGKHMVTASYMSPQMQALHQSAVDAGIAIVNEVGLDPGLDHMSAMKVIDAVHARGGVVDSFVSLCGGLPAPEVASNPLGYKFSWSPKGVLLAGRNSARYLMGGTERAVPGERLFDSAKRVQIGGPAFSLEQLPNRNSLHYKTIYGLEKASTVYRGTLRYAGFSEAMRALVDLGLFADTLVDSKVTPTWADLLASRVSSASNTTSNVAQVVRRHLASEHGEDAAARIQASLEHLDLFDASEAGSLVDGVQVIDALCDRMQQKCKYQAGERDMCLLHHEFEVSWPASTEKVEGDREKISSTLLLYGHPYPKGPSAMASTVGLPTAVAAKLLLNGTISRRGVLLPTTEDVYRPILREVRQAGIVFKEQASGRMQEVLAFEP